MDTQPFHVAAYPQRKLIVLTFVQAFWDEQVADSFRQQCLAAVASLGCPPGEHLILADLHNAVLQSQATYEKMQDLIGTATAARIAMVAATPLARMQTKRLQIRDTIVMFADRDEAEAWLFADGQQAAA